MIQLDKNESTAIIEKAVAYLEHRDFNTIKADMEGYETPKSYLNKDGGLKVTPDITADKAGIKYYFEVSIKTENAELLKSKWRFLDVLSRMNKSRFKIFTTSGHYSFTEEMMDDLNLEKNMIKL